MGGKGRGISNPGGSVYEKPPPLKRHFSPFHSVLLPPIPVFLSSFLRVLLRRACSVVGLPSHVPRPLLFLSYFS